MNGRQFKLHADTFRLTMVRMYRDYKRVLTTGLATLQKVANSSENYPMQQHKYLRLDSCPKGHPISYPLQGIMIVFTSNPSGIITVITKYDRRLYFQLVCHFTPGVTPSPSHNTSTGPMSFPGVPHFHPIILPLVPCPFQGDVPQWLVTVLMGVPPTRTELGYPQARSDWGTPSQDWGTP